MKTLKLIIAGIAIATLAYSCSNDRDDEARQKSIEQVKNSNQKIKLNKSGIQNREARPESTNDTVRVRGINSVLSEDPDTSLNPDDSEIIPPGDVKPPKK